MVVDRHLATAQLSVMPVRGALHVVGYGSATRSHLVLGRHQDARRSLRARLDRASPTDDYAASTSGQRSHMLCNYSTQIRPRHDLSQARLKYRTARVSHNLSVEAQHGPPIVARRHPHIDINTRERF
jgi:hypothetical protein